MASAITCPDCGKESYSAAEGKDRLGCPYCSEPTGATVICPSCDFTFDLSLIATLRQEVEDLSEELREANLTIARLQAGGPRVAGIDMP